MSICSVPGRVRAAFSDVRSRKIVPTWPRDTRNVVTELFLLFIQALNPACLRFGFVLFKQYTLMMLFVHRSFCLSPLDLLLYFVSRRGFCLFCFLLEEFPDCQWLKELKPFSANFFTLSSSFLNLLPCRKRFIRRCCCSCCSFLDFFLAMCLLKCCVCFRCSFPSEWIHLKWLNCDGSDAPSSEASQESREIGKEVYMLPLSLSASIAFLGWTFSNSSVFYPVRISCVVPRKLKESQ